MSHGTWLSSRISAATPLVYGAAALNDVPVLVHTCDNPLCQVIGREHPRPLSHADNRRAHLARRSLAGNPLGKRGHLQRTYVARIGEQRMARKRRGFRAT
jgi:hypothetical protein